MSFNGSNAVQGASSGAQVGGMFGPYGLVIGGAVGAIDGGFGGPVSKAMGMNSGGVQLGKIKPGPYTNSFNSFYKQEGQLDHLSGFASELNDLLQGQLTQTAPDYFDTLKQQDRNISSLSKGLIPADVLQQANRASGLQAIQGGFGGGSPIGQANDARNLGLTSLQLEQQGMQELPVLNALNKDANPVAATNFIFTPQALLQRRDQIKALNAHLTNQQSLINYGIGQQNQQNEIAAATSLAGLVSGYGKQAGWFGGANAAPGTTTNPGAMTYIPYDAGSFGGGGDFLQGGG